jgi:hypothetical protein
MVAAAALGASLRHSLAGSSVVFSLYLDDFGHESRELVDDSR